MLILVTTFCVSAAAVAEEGVSGQDASTVDTQTAPDDPRTAFFEKKIRPVLAEHCYQCHAADAKHVRGGLLLDSREGTRDGGESGPVIEPGNPDDSLLISSLRHESYEMPPDRRLPDHIIRDFEQWIRDGAVDPRSGGQTMERTAIDLDAGRQFWSFQAVTHPTVPEVDSDWSRTEIDQFILDKLVDRDLEPAPDAGPQQVCRRLYFGLIGRPPSPDDIRSFVDGWKKSGPDSAIETTTERLLASPHYGERWGRHWLDVVRFAESSGGGRSLMFPHAWRFRDYIIQSFNEDKPFDQLVREHLAGDLLPAADAVQRDEQVTGVGYLTLGPTNYELQDKELLRMEVVDEQIDTVGRTFLGMTLGCCRCHDHKFDPIPTTDYYALAGIFRSTKTLLPGNVSSYVTTSLDSLTDPDAEQQWKATDSALKTSITDLKSQLGSAASAGKNPVDAETLPGIVVDDTQAVFERVWTPSTSLLPYVDDGYQHDAGEKNGRRVRFEVLVDREGRYHVRYAYGPSSNRCVHVPVTVRHAEGESTVVIDQRQPPNVDGLFHELGRFRFTPNREAVISIDTDACGPGVVIVDAVQLLHESDVKQSPAEAELAALRTELTELEQRLAEHTKKKPVTPVAMSVRDEDETQDWYVHVRGVIRNHGPQVPRGALSVVRETEENGFEIGAGQSGRLQLAEWIASPDNPLTARVYVNRVWQKLVGRGLVRTPDNFGSTGRPPTHPELLDYLAWQFVHEDGWSTRNLIRRIVSSRIYRLATQTSESAVAADPENELLGRAFRKRLEAEALRDTILMVSGQLDADTSGGLTIARITQYDNGYDHRKHSVTLPSIYVPVLRNSSLPFFDVFDAPNTNLVVGRRNESTLPAQALYLLNSPFVLEQSQAAAEKFVRDYPPNSCSLHDRLNEACLMTLGRTPTARELRLFSDLISQAEKNESADTDVWATVFQALFASMDFRYLD